MPVTEPCIGAAAGVARTTISAVKAVGATSAPGSARQAGEVTHGSVGTLLVARPYCVLGLPSCRVSSSSCHRSQAAWRVTPREVAISAHVRPALRAYFTVTSSVLSHVWRTCCMAFRVATISACQPSWLDRDEPMNRGPFIALCTVGPPLYLAIASACAWHGSLSRNPDREPLPNRTIEARLS
jgi:hypothetical protein